MCIISISYRLIGSYLKNHLPLILSIFSGCFCQTKACYWALDWYFIAKERV